VDLPAPDERHQRVPGLLEGEPALDGLRRVQRQLDRAGVTEEVGGVEHVDVQRVALDPLAAVQQPSQHPDRLGQSDIAKHLQCIRCARLVGDRTDAADPGGDVGCLGEPPPTEQRLEEPRRLEDPQLDVLDLPALEADRHRSLSLDPGEVVGLDRAALSHVPLLS